LSSLSKTFGTSLSLIFHCPVNKHWSPQGKVVIICVIINVINIIWFARNQVIFEIRIAHGNAFHTEIIGAMLANY
jgi:hypothetical protein